MSTFWGSLIYLLVVWGIALYEKISSLGFDGKAALISALFFSLYFCLPLAGKNRIMLQMMFSSLTILIFLLFSGDVFNGFVLLISLVIAKVALDYLKGWPLYIQLILLYVIIISPYIFPFEVMMLIYMTLLLLIISLLFYLWQQTDQAYHSLSKTHDKVVMNFRKLKRQATRHEKNVRQEERNQVAREIHDSVGHRLTALLMQLEVSRMQSQSKESKEKFSQLKSLVQVSLDETREAVKALKSEETTGLTAVIQLIRKLEAESHLRVSFHVQSGALSTSLTNNQSVVLYRSVQEGLTNMMRHSGERQAKVEFSIVGKQFFRFQISHIFEKKVTIQEGFGLKSMRERLRQLDGSLKINQVEGEFRLIGTFPIQKGDN